MSKKENVMLALKLEEGLTVVPDKNPQYFEADVQLRDPNEELINFVINQCNKNNVWVASILPSKHGIDLKVSSQKFARNLGTRLKRSYKGELKMTRSIFTRNRQTSKDVYRVTVCFRMEK